MKNLLKITAAFLILILSLPAFSFTASAGSSGTTAFAASGKDDFRGVWVATVLNIDYPAKATTNAEQLKNEAVTILDNAKNTGFNAVFLQVRPSSDALYPSKYFPWSKYLTGTQGMAPSDGFDPLAFWVEEAHKRGIQLHAWINPYRITKKTSTDPSFDFQSLAPSHPAQTNPGWVVKYNDGNLYFNPGIPEVRQMISDSILEIIQNYDVDGIHFDDYFYPGTDFNDKDTYKKYGAGYSNIDDWRRSNVNALISQVSQTIKSTGKKVRFGISPFGIWANKSKNSLGSDTKGMQSYYDHYADTRKWVKEGMIDYIAPQIYWNIGYSVADYSKILSWWNNVVAGTGVDLYVGQAAYREGSSSSSSAWYGVSEIERQMQLNAKTSNVKGSIFYNYSSIRDLPALGAMIKTIYEQQDGVTASIPVGVTRPSDSTDTSFSQFYLNGSSDPGKPLYLNGAPVEGRSVQGFFGFIVPLQPGANVFTLSQDGSYKTRVIYRQVTSSAPQKMSKAAIASGSAFPQAPEYRRPGEKITLSCDAPIGAKVTVKIGGKTYAMTPEKTSASGSGIYATTFNCTYTIPSYTGTPRYVDLGQPVYSMTYKGVKKAATAPGIVGVIMKDAPFYAKVAKDVIDSYDTPSAGNGAGDELYKNMVDYVTGITGSYVRLASGQWVKKTSVTTYTSKTQLHAAVQSPVYSTGEKWDTLSLNLSVPAVSTASFDGSTLKLNIATALSAPLPALPENALFSAINVSKNGSTMEYALDLKSSQNLDGFYIEKTSSGINLKIKRHLVSQNTAQPLAGKTIMLDPGHGGGETGAIGPLWQGYLEKDINLKSALKVKAALEKLGATVLMTRNSDKTLSLEDRLKASRDARPDMFISIHANSMDDNVDISKLDGLSTYYREDLAQPLAQAVFDKTIGDLGRNGQGVHQRNFYVIRGTWTPSILIESGFLPNPEEFEWLKDDTQETRLAQSISEAVAKYFQN